MDRYKGDLKLGMKILVTFSGLPKKKAYKGIVTRVVEKDHARITVNSGTRTFYDWNVRKKDSGVWGGDNCSGALWLDGIADWKSHLKALE